MDADADIDRVLRTMEEHKIRRLPVIENHRLVGMISEADPSRRLPEEQVGHFVEAAQPPPSGQPAITGRRRRRRGRRTRGRIRRGGNGGTDGRG
ncbi:CBS domain-containing protein [Streptomyces chiangmaiensis]|uniref:CBS domain-containing protein n=1 Tax=Streptomyces chiangmaiensis TaxID=766497 RepID=A0ABU7FPL5_9ACTN|nr:CBS domain-containing protein [Streptomyces chiangmaiensis]MED7825889.1 CBS domain-containing protein [Streptomyces chiangmaiensis]